MRQTRHIDERDIGGRRTTTIVEERRPAAPDVPHRSSLAMAWTGMVCAGIGLAAAVVTTVLGFRLGFLLADANRSNRFVDFIYDLTAPLVEPFQDIFSNRSVDGGGIVEPATLVAGGVYLIAAVLLMLFVWGLGTTTPRIEHRDRPDLVHGH